MDDNSNVRAGAELSPAGISEKTSNGCSEWLKAVVLDLAIDVEVCSKSLADKSRQLAYGYGRPESSCSTTLWTVSSGQNWSAANQTVKLFRGCLGTGVVSKKN